MSQQKYTSTSFLILANLLPLLGVFVWDWDIGAILYLYWFETFIIGIFTLVRMVKRFRYEAQIERKNGKKDNTNRSQRFFLPPFFTIHYSGFMGGHLLFLLIFFDFTYSFSEILLFSIPLWVSHGLSYIRNFRGAEEYKIKTAEEIMLSPYKRIVLMHLTIIFGAMVSVFLFGEVENQAGILIVLVILKILLDTRSHLKEHTSSLTKG
ncbi:MAG: DUF6498-containing protein [Candidatus Magasanikbacteria bacterium]